MNATSAGASAIDIEDLQLDIAGRPLLRGASLRVERGQMGLLTGASGSGKSAVLKLLLGLAPRASHFRVGGRASLLGLDSLRTPTPRLARRAGLLFQQVQHQITQPDVGAELAFRPENLGLAPRDVAARVEDVARRFALGPLLERPTARVSGGEAKRIALAALLAGEPEALLLDEPLGSLDAAWRGRLVDDLRREAAGRATLIVEHRAAPLARAATRRWNAQGGRLEIVSVEPTVSSPSGRPQHPSFRRARIPESSGPLVLAEGLRVKRGTAQVLDGVDLEVGPGITALVGPNGGGKSTLLRALAGLESYEGKLRVAGLDPGAVAPRRLAGEVGFVAQQAEALFFATSAEEEIAFGPRNLRGRADPVEMRNLAAGLGLASRLEQHPLTLSGGEQERLALACALAHGPRVLLLDEPTVGLDVEGIRAALDLLGARGPSAAVLVATHDPEVVALAHRVITLDGGRIAHDATLAHPLEVTS